MKFAYSYLVLLLGLSLLTLSCSQDENDLMSDEEIGIRSIDDDKPIKGCYNCRVFLSVDKNCNMKVTLTKGCVGNVTYQWTTPYGNDNTPNPDASMDGNYCVTIFTDQGCWASACTNIKDCEDDCDNDCIEVGFSNTVKCLLEVNLDECDTKPKKIIWTTPMNYIPVGTTVKADVDGVYCAHVTFSDGCQYTDCINIKDCQEFCEDNCAIEFEINNSGTDCYMDVITSGCAKPLEIEWTYPSGATTNYWRISIQQNGTYCVKVTQPNGCELIDCIDIENCGTGPVCTDFELEWVNFEDGQLMYPDDGGSPFIWVNEYEKVGSNSYATNPVAYVSGQDFKVEALFKTDCPNVETVFIRGTHIRLDGIVNFPEQEIDVNANGEIHYNWEYAMMNGSDFNFPDNVEFHDPFEILWEVSMDQVDWSPIHTSANPLYVARNAWNYGSSNPTKQYHTYYRVTCQKAQGLSAENEITDAIWEIFEDKSFARADGQELTYYESWNTGVYFAEDLIPDGDGQCSAHSQAFLNCLKAHGYNDNNDYSFVTASQDGSHLGLLVQNFVGITAPPTGQNWVVDSWASGGEPTGLPNGFDIEYVVIPRNGYNAGSANDFVGNIIHSEIVDLDGLAGQNQANPKAYFHNHQIVVLGSTYYDVPYGQTYGSLDELKGNMFGYIFVATEVTISENLLGADIDEDGFVSGDVTLDVWLIDGDLDDQVELNGDLQSDF